MLKKMILGIIISVVVLTVGAGVIYGYQKNSNADDELAVINNKLYRADNSGSSNSNLKENGNNKYRLLQGECDHLNCPNENCPNSDCDKRDCTGCTERYNNMENNRENNRYIYNKDETKSRIITLIINSE